MRRLRHHRRLGKTFDEPALLSQLASWKTDAEAERGLRPHKLLETALLSVALDPTSSAFSEFLDYATAPT